MLLPTLYSYKQLVQSVLPLFIWRRQPLFVIVQGILRWYEWGVGWVKLNVALFISKADYSSSESGGNFHYWNPAIDQWWLIQVILSKQNWNLQNLPWILNPKPHKCRQFTTFSRSILFLYLLDSFLVFSCKKVYLT